MLNQKLKVSICGVGMMGHGLAYNIIKAGHKLVFLNHQGNQPVEDLIALGGTQVESIYELVSDAEIIVTCVTGEDEVEDVILRKGGIRDNLKPGSIVIDCTTSIPDTTRKIASFIEESGCDFADVAMTRTPKEAAQGTLGLIVGSETSLFEKLHPFLTCIGESIVHAGPVGSGHTLKLLHNFVSLGFAALLAEAAAAANESNVNSSIFSNVLEAGAGDGVVFQRLKPFIESEDSSALRFAIENATKDLSYYSKMLKEIGAKDRIAESILSTYKDAVDSGQGKRFVPELVSILRNVSDK